MSPFLKVTETGSVFQSLLKTGSTTLQQFLKANHSLLYRNNILVPTAFRSGVDGNHDLIRFVGMNSERWVGTSLASKRHWSDNKDIKSLLSKSTNLLEQEISKSSNSSTIILSDEFLSWGLTVNEIKVLIKFLSQYASSIKVICYVREPCFAASSRFCNSVRWDIGDNYLPFSLPSPGTYPNYEFNRTIKNWLQCIPQGDLIVRRFQSSSFVANSFIVDFFPSCGLHVERLTTDFAQKIANKSLSLTVLRYAWHIHDRFRREIPLGFNKTRSMLSPFLFKYFSDSTRFLPSRDQYDEYSHYYFSANQYLSDYISVTQNVLWDVPDYLASSPINLADKSQIDIQAFHALYDLFSQLVDLDKKI